MSERDFEIGSRKFKLNKIDAIKQFHIARRITPVLSELIPAMGSIAKAAKSKKKVSTEAEFDEIAKVLAPIMTGISKLSDEDSDKVLYGLLSSVEMQQQTGNWARVSTDTSLMINDLELNVLLNLAGRAFMFNMGGFISALPQSS